MGQSLARFSTGSEDIGPIVEKCYSKHFGKGFESSFVNFYRAVCEIIEEINKTFGHTQFKVPSVKTLEDSYNRHHPKSSEPKTKEEGTKKEELNKDGKKNEGTKKEELNKDGKKDEGTKNALTKKDGAKEELTKKEGAKKERSKAEGTGYELTREEFQDILGEILKTSPGFTGFGAKDAIIYIFSVPLGALLVKQRLFPRAISNEVLIPGVTSATVFALAKLNKI